MYSPNTPDFEHCKVNHADSVPRAAVYSTVHTEFDFSQCPGLHQNHPMQARAWNKYGRFSSVIRARASRAGPRGSTGGNLLLLVDKLVRCFT
eukprot:COSAG02_NODE_30_length_50867_cov_66.594331_49_plen_92_part_00